MSAIRGTALAAAFLAGPVALAQTPTFTAVVIDPARSGDAKAVGDIDLDGKADPILGGSSLAWYEAGASWARRVIRAVPLHDAFTTDLQALDLDADGNVDLVVGDSNGPENVLWFENPLRNPPAGLGSDPRVEANWLHHVIGTHGAIAHDVEVADVNRDGRLDVLTSGFGHTNLWVQSSPTSWTGRDLTALPGMTVGVFFGDIDRDGRADIATPSGWFKAPDDPLAGTWTRYVITGASDGDEILLADLNGDGRLDVLTMVADGSGPFAWFEAPADPTQPSWTRRLIDAAMGSHHPEAMDFDGDGRLDVLMGQPATDLSIYFNQGGSPPTLTKMQLDVVAAHNARAGDLDGDGDLDIFGADLSGSPPAKVHLNAGVPPPTAIRLHPVAPCRLVDTRGPLGPSGGPTLFAQSTRVFSLAGTCGIPATARALVLNVTVAQPSALGHVTLYPVGVAPPRASMLNFAAGRTRANNGTVTVAAGGWLAVFSGQVSGTSHLIIDVTGYYQ